MAGSVLLLALVATGALSVPIDVSRFDEDTSCARKCTESGKFRYEPGKTYVFSYETRTTTGIEGASEDQSTITMAATVDVMVLSDCEYVLKLDNVRLMEIDPATPSRQKYSPVSREFRRKLEENPLRFGFQDGRVDSVCPDDGDEVWIVNLKRGVLSALQNAMVSLDRDQRVTETDVAGECDAEYKVVRAPSPWSQATTVKKTKNLMGCRNRHGYNSAVHAIPYHVQSDVQSLPLMNSRHECEQEINGGRLISATCQESHVFRPFSKGSNGAVTNTSQTLRFTKEKHNEHFRPGFINRRTDMHFEHSSPEAANSRSRKEETESRLKELCRQTQDDIRPETPQLFADLVQLMKELNAQSLRDIYRQVRSENFCRQNQERTRKFFMDAIPMVGTRASVSIIEDLISKNIVDGVESDIWVTSLAFIPNPSREMIAEVKPLLRKKPTGRVMLSVSALVNNYCRMKPCEDDLEVDAIVSILEEYLGHNCDIRGNDAEKIKMALRAIGNTGHAERAVPTLNRCFMKDDLPMEIRLSAVTAFRHMSCKADLNNMMELFRNKEEDSELRIAAYLSVIECPTQWVLEQVKEALEQEKVNQVGSFVWTHLTNLMETSDPHRQEIRAILEDETLAREFNLDNRKFSRNYEGSVFFEKINTGAKAESNIIFSSKSFLPRSAMLNLTVDLFGHAVNLIEIGGRVEGLEYYLEGLFGPEGVLKENSGKESWRRSKREVIRRDKLDSIKKQYGITSDELAGSLYMRMFGNELAYMSMGGPGKAKKQSPNLMDMLLKLARHNSYQVTQNIMFMDSSLVIPTSVGLPLTLTVNGTASMDLKLSGKMDVRKATSRPSNMHIEGVVQPSGAVEVASSMQIDAYVLRSGLKMVTTLHSSTAANGKIEIKDGKVLNVEFDSPREKMEVINLSTKFFVLHREAEREQKMTDVDRKSKTVCSGERLAKLTGLEICGSVGFSNASSVHDAPYFPLTGPISLGINLLKRDSHSGYTFSAKYSNEPNRKTARLAFDTPGSREDRNLVADVELDTDDGSLAVDMISPWKKASLKGSVSLKEDLKKLSARLLVDKREEYLAKMELRTDRSGPRIKYIPVVELTTGGKVPYMTVGGSVERKGIEELAVDLSIKDVVPKPVNIKSNIIHSDDEKSASGKITVGKDVYQANVILRKDRKPLKYNASIHMSCPRGELIKAEVAYEQSGAKGKFLLDKIVKKPIKLEGSLENSEGKRKSKKLVKLNVELPQINFDVNGVISSNKKGKPMITSKLTVNYQLPKKGRDRVTISTKGRNLSTASLTKYDVLVITNFNKNKMYNFETKGDFELGPSSLDSNLKIRYGDNPKDQDKVITFSQVANHKLTRNKRDANINMKLEYPAKNINYLVKGSHLMTSDSLDSNLVIRYGKNEQIMASAKLNNYMKKKNTASGEVGLSYPGRKLRLTSQLVKVADGQYNNTIDMNWGKGKAKIESTYSNPRKMAHAVTSVINIAKSDPIYLEGSVDLEPNHYKISSGIAIAKDMYKITGSSKKKDSSYDGELSVQYPGQRVVADVSADWRNKYLGKVDIKWGKGKQVLLDTTFSNSRAWSGRKVGGSLSLRSPFPYAEYIDVNADYSSDRQEYKTNADVAWSRADKVAGTLTIKRPISLRRLEASLSATTPFRDFRSISVEVNHRLDDDLSTTVKASADRHNVDVTLTGNNRGSDYRTDLSGSLVMKSSIRDLELLTINLKHVHTGRKLESSGTMVRNQYKKTEYSLSFDMDEDYNIESQATFVCPGLHMVSAKLNTQLSDQPQTVEAEVEWSPTKKVALSGELTHYGLRYIDTSIKLSTPVRDVSLSGRHAKRDDVWISGATLEFAPRKRIKVQTKFSREDKILGEIIITAPFRSFEKFKLSGEHSGDVKRSITSRGEFELKPQLGLFEAIANYRNGHQRVANLRVNTPFREVRYSEIRATYQPGSVQLEVEYLPNQVVNIESEYRLDNINDLSGELTITTPISSFDYIKTSFLHRGSSYRCRSVASVEYPRREEYTATLNYENDDKIDVSLDLKAPRYDDVRLTVSHSGSRRDFNSHAEITYQRYKKIEGDLIFSLKRGGKGPVMSIESMAKSPYSQDFNFKLTHEGNIVDFKSNLVSSYGRLNRVTYNVGFLSSWNSIRANTDLELASDIIDPQSAAAEFNLKGEAKDFKGNFEGTYQGRSIDASIASKIINGIEASVALSTPFKVARDISASVKQGGDRRHFTSKVKAEYNNDAYQADVSFSNDGDQIDGTLAVETPIHNYENLAGKFNFKGDLKNMEGSAQAQYARGKEITVSGHVDLIGESRKIGATINTPFEDYRTLSASGNLTGSLTNFLLNGRLQYATHKILGLTSKVDLEDRSKVLEGSVATPYSGYEQMAATVNINGNLERFSSSASVDYARGKRIHANIDLDTLGRSKSASVHVTTPFEKFRENSAVFKLRNDPSDLRLSGDVTYLNSQKIAFSTTGNLESNPKSASAILKTPFSGFEDMSVVAHYDGRPSRHQADAMVKYAPGKKIEIDGSLTIQEPKRGRLEARASYGDSKTVTLNGALDLVSKTKTASLRTTTPYPGFESQGVSLTLDGSPLNFQASATVESSKLRKPILARGSLDYKTPTNMDAKLSFTSAIPRAENLRLVLKNSDEREYTSHAEAQWSLRDVISVDGSFERNKRWRRTRTRADISISTPFEKARKLSSHFENNFSKTKRNIVLSIDHENRNVLDAKLEKGDGKLSANIATPHPRPMKLIAEGSFSSDLVTSSVYLNWDDRDPRSNVKLVTEYKDDGNDYSLDKELSVKISRADRTLAVESKLEKSSIRLASVASVALDDKKVSLETELSDRSRGYTKMYEGNIRLNTPYKVLRMEASHEDNLEKITSEAAWFWDAERDQSKKIVLSSVLQKTATFVKSDLKLEAPSIRKEIRLTSEATLNRGRTVFDGKSELSYSPDSRQTLAITTKIEKIGRSYSDNSNYSVSVGLSHPSTNTDIQIISHAGHSDSRMSASAEVTYLNSRRRQQNMELRGEIDKLRKEIHLQILSPSKSVEINGKLRTDNGYHLSLHNVYDKSKSIDTSVIVDPVQGNIALSMGSDLNDPRKTVNLKAGYLADNIISVEAYHVSSQGKVSDGLMSLTLNTSRILHTRLHWRPSVIQEIKNELDRRSQIYQDRAGSSLKDFLDEISRELSRRVERVSDAMSRDVTPIYDVLSEASNSLDVEVALLLDELNELGLQEALAAAQDVIDAIIKYADETLTEMSESYKRALEKIVQIYESASSRLVKYEEVLAAAAELAKEYQIEIENFVKETVTKIIDEIERLAEASRYHYNKLAEQGREVARDAMKKARDIVDRTLSHPKVQEVKAKLTDLINRIPQLAKPEKIAQISRKVQDIAKSYKMSIVNKYVDAIAQAHKTVSESVDKLMQHDDVKQLHAAANEVFQQGKWAYNYWEVEKNVVEGLRSLVKKVRDVVTDELRESWDSIARLEDWRLIIYDPQGGEIQFEIYLPVALKSLRELPDTSIPKIKKTYKKFSNGYNWLKDYQMEDTYYSLKPSTDIANWIPPFKAYASVSGKQHFTTFDGRHYEFAGLCSYVLAQDFMDGNFSVILNYDGDWANVRKRSLTITAGDKRIDIFPDYRVQVDSRPQELPYEFDSIMATRHGNTIIVDTGKGLIVEVDLANDLYAVTISGWFFGKTAGLFGTYDNEPSNDWIMPSRRITDDVREFAQSWEVAGSCRSTRNFAKTVRVEEDQPGYKQCAGLYVSNTSPFRPCFKQVSTEDAFTKCMYDHSVESSDIAICSSAALHRLQCSRMGVPLQMPSECVKCEAPNGRDFTPEEGLILSERGVQPPNSADVVFVIEEKTCNKKASEGLQSMAESIDSAMRREGLTGNRYGIVGYGGFEASNSPLSHTIGGRIMNDARRFGVGADSLNFERKGGVADVMEAIMFASKYPFRTGVSKSIVLMPCSSCEVQSVSFEATKELLMSRGITLHLLKKHDFEFRSNKSPKSTNIFGIDNDGAYSYGGKGQTMAADSKLLRKLRVPSDNCVALAQSTSGKMFNLARLIEGRQRMQRAFREAWSKSIAKSAEPMSCQECRCVPDENGAGVSICNRCDQSTSNRSAIQNSRYRRSPDQSDFETQLQTYLNVRQE